MVCICGSLLTVLSEASVTCLSQLLGCRMVEKTSKELFFRDLDPKCSDFSNSRFKKKTQLKSNHKGLCREKRAKENWVYFLAPRENATT